MGSKLVRVADLMADLQDRETAAVYAPDQIVYGDLIRTLKFDPTKYHRPHLDGQGHVVYNSIFLRAASEAGINSILVDVPDDDVAFTGTPADVVSSTYLFFNGKRLPKTESADELKAIFGKYLTACNESLIVRGVQRGRIDNFTAAVLESDLLQYTLHGELADVEDKHHLLAPTKALYHNLETYLSPRTIRSVNGIIPPR